MQRPEAALDTLLPFAGLGSDDAGIPYLTGMASIQAGNMEDGVRYLEQARQLRPDDESIRLELARAYVAVGRSGDARTLLRDTFAGTGGAPGLEEGIIQVLAEMQADDAEDGAAMAESLVQRFPEEPRALMVNRIRLPEVRAVARLLGSPSPR